MIFLEQCSPSMSSFLSRTLYAILGIAFVGYTAYQLEGLFFGSKLEVAQPENGAHLTSSHVKVKGEAAGVNVLDLNGQQIFTDEDGNFEEELILPYGFNIIVVSAEGRFGKKFNEERMVYVTGR